MSLYLLRVEGVFQGYQGFVFTGKIVKSLLINAMPSLSDLFKPTPGTAPKLIHVSPLYTAVDGRTRCIYSYVECSGNPSIVKCSGPLKPVVLDGRYFFYIGVHESVVKPVELLEALAGFTGCYEYAGRRVCSEIDRVDAWNMVEHGLKLAEEALASGGLKIVFSSPTLLRDPLRTSGKYRSLIPTPFNVFAVPVFIKQYTKGVYTPRRHRAELTILHRLLNETYTALKTVKTKWIKYGKTPEPSIVGYVNYVVNKKYYEEASAKIDVKTTLGEALAYALTLGVGSGRATGFGHIDAKPYNTGAGRHESSKQSPSQAL